MGAWPRGPKASTVAEPTHTINIPARKNGLTSRSALPDLTQLLTVNKTLTWLDLRDNGFTSGLVCGVRVLCVRVRL